LPAKYAEDKLVTKRSIDWLQMRFLRCQKNGGEGASFNLLQDIEGSEARR
jgi:hypothetical protein